MNASLKDIAQAAGVSVSLVSKVLNRRLGTTGVSAEMAEKIEKTAARLHYRKNASAQSLRAGRHDVVGVFIHKHGEAGTALMDNLVSSISRIARQAHQKLMLNFFETDEEFLDLAQFAHRGFMDGLLIGGLSYQDLDDTILGIARAGLPLVTLLDEPLHPEIPNQGMDQVAVGRLATRHLVEQGCRRIGHIRCTEPRYRGYVDALIEAGLVLNPDWVFEAGEDQFGYAAGEKAARRILQQGLPLDGVVGTSDSHAAGLINTLIAGGKRVPAEIRVTGVDNSPYCDLFRPSITSVSQESWARGERAMRMLMEMQEGRAPDPVQVAPVLVPRQSSVG